MARELRTQVGHAPCPVDSVFLNGVYGTRVQVPVYYLY
jgi:hypothetical protein